MKTRLILAAGFVGLSFVVANAQKDENDDMYFNSKDRAKLNAGKSFLVRETAGVTTADQQTSKQGNPTDTYTGRLINPEYSGQTGTTSAQAQSNQYFSSSYVYKPAGVNNNLYNNYNSSFYSPYYGNYGMSSYGAYGYNPYMYGGYGSMFSPFSSMYYSPYSMFNNGWSIGMGYGMGSYMNYGYPYYGMGYGYPYSYGYNYGYNYGYGGYGYPGGVVVNNGGDVGRHTVIGHRPGRTGTTSYAAGGRTSGNSSAYNSSNGTGRQLVGGRAAASNNAYYDRGWRQNPNVNPAATYGGSPSRSNVGSGNTGSQYSGGWNGSSSRSSWGDGGRTSGWGGNNSGFSNNFGGGGGRSSSFGGGSFGGGSFGGGGGGGRSGGGGGGGGHGRGR